MKKYVVAVATTTIATLGSMLVAPAAQAAPYPRSVDTDCIAVADDNRVRPREQVKVKFKWTAEGNLTPSGRVEYAVIRKGTGVVDRGAFYSNSRSESSVNFFRFSRSGTYYVRFATDTRRDSIFRDCSTSTSPIKVDRRY